MKLVLLDSSWEPTFWDHVLKNVPEHYFFIIDWKLNKDKTKIFLAIQDGKIIAMMLIYDRRIVQIRGNPEAAEILMNEVNLEKAEINAFNEHEAIILKKYKPIVRHEMILMTLHRPDNVDDPRHLGDIMKALEQIKDLLVVFPVHPRTEKQLQGSELYGRLLKQKHVKAIKPVSYHDNLKLIKNADAVLTDSGGMQKEAFWLHTPCITLRNNSGARPEWIETVNLKANRFTGTDTKKILGTLEQTLKDKTIKERLRKLPNPFGDGKASEKVLSILKEFCSRS